MRLDFEEVRNAAAAEDPEPMGRPLVQPSEPPIEPPELWVARVVAHEPDKPGWIEWTRWGADKQTVALRGLGDTWLSGEEVATHADVVRLSKARELVQDVPQRLGRPAGPTIPRDEFLRDLGEAVRWLRQNHRRVTQRNVVTALASQVGKPYPKTTLQGYLADEGEAFWMSVSNGEWRGPGD